MVRITFICLFLLSSFIRTSDFGESQKKTFWSYFCCCNLQGQYEEPNQSESFNTATNIFKSVLDDWLVSNIGPMAIQYFSQRLRNYGVVWSTQISYHTATAIFLSEYWKDYDCLNPLEKLSVYSYICSNLTKIMVHCEFLDTSTRVHLIVLGYILDDYIFLCMLLKSCYEYYQNRYDLRKEEREEYKRKIYNKKVDKIKELIGEFKNINSKIEDEIEIINKNKHKKIFIEDSNEIKIKNIHIENNTDTERPKISNSSAYYRGEKRINRKGKNRENQYNYFRNKKNTENKELQIDNLDKNYSIKDLHHNYLELLRELNGLINNRTFINYLMKIIYGFFAKDGETFFGDRPEQDKFEEEIADFSNEEEILNAMNNLKCKISKVINQINIDNYINNININDIHSKINE